MQGHPVRGRPRLREPFNAITHMLGALVALVGGTALVVSAAGDPWRMLSFAIYALAR